jgi:hypothetical protein
MYCNCHGRNIYAAFSSISSACLKDLQADQINVLILPAGFFPPLPNARSVPSQVKVAFRSHSGLGKHNARSTVIHMSNLHIIIVWSYAKPYQSAIWQIRGEIESCPRCSCPANTFWKHSRHCLLHRFAPFVKDRTYLADAESLSVEDPRKALSDSERKTFLGLGEDGQWVRFIIHPAECKWLSKP